jgi:surface antigen
MRTPDRGELAAAIGRGAGLLAGTGAALGGAAATVDWPVVGTFFGALEGAVVGAIVGAVDGVVLGSLLAGRATRWLPRIASGGLAFVVEVVGLARYRGPIQVPIAVAATLVVIGVVAAAALGPLIAFGAAPVNKSDAAPASDVALRLLSWGAAVGAGIGAVAGLVIGIRTYLPTAPFAAVEGALLGSVSGAVLAGWAVGIALVSRMRVRR